MTNINQNTPPVGVITPPNHEFNRGLFSDAEAKAKFHALDRDIYQAGKPTPYEDTKSTPKGIVAAIGIVAAAVIVKKTGILNKIKTLFTRTH